MWLLPKQDKSDPWRNRRALNWMCLLAGLIYPFAAYLVTGGDPEKLKFFEMISMAYYGLLTAISVGYTTNATWQSNTKLRARPPGDSVEQGEMYD